MNRFYTKIIFTVALIFAVIIIACKNSFEYSPYAANVNNKYKDIGHKNLNRIIQKDTVKIPEFKFAVFSDPHFRYNELAEAVRNINRRKDIDFVIVNGDITHNGYLQEYELFHDQMENLKIPYITVIGNHDYISNGEKIYKEIYGKINYTIIYNNCLFVMFDNIFWESNQLPDFEWLEDQINESEIYDKVFVICHQPPYTIQFTDSTEELYKELMLKYNVDLSIHGHIHRFEYKDYYKDGMQYLAVGPILKDEFVIITVNNEEVKVEQVEF